MRKAIKWMFWMLGGVLLLAVLVWLASRMSRVPPEQAQALAMLDAPIPVPAGRNGFAALWSLQYDIPVDKAEALLAQDVQRFADFKPESDGGNVVTQAFASLLDEVPRLDDGAPTEPALCNLHDGNCLATIRASLEAYAPVIESRREISRRVAALDGYGYFHMPYAPRLDTPIPPYQALTRDLSIHAYDFAQGQIDVALKGVCRDASIASKIVDSSDSLIASMVGIAMVKGAGSLLIEMLSELPSDYPLPAQCGEVFDGGVAMSAAVCSAMMGEGRFSTGGLRTLNLAPAGGVIETAMTRLIFDVEKTAARGASKFTWYCDEQARQQIAADQPLHNPTAQPSMWSLDCVANAAGCILMDIAAPAYDEYGLRLQDAQAQQQLVATWLWLRGRDGDARPLAERLASRPQALKSPARSITVSEDGKSLRIDMYEAGRFPDGFWQLPLPEWMADSGSAP
ncbi:hypothetical protein CSC70_06610 [Pseudoxanthomonas kalamensis DSM 18571]|uniref:hypothetical protein n=1 Tax=Pseudoxanthomonas kalamensis TaxID=289483 RepID=UPI001390A9B3|nr:hypothetical protein [Pseudoxanthomonas kalamensis]KAF1710354.1 hypothetical protein CSC70_06610 [Pseudoxanthomonas kalamensis DSM 18571]